MTLLDDVAVAVTSGVDVLLTDMLLSRGATGTYDPETGKRTGDTVTTYGCRGIVLNYTNFDRLNTRIGENDRRVLITQATLATEPIMGDLVIVKNKSYRVVHVDADPAGATWDLQASL